MGDTTDDTTTDEETPSFLRSKWEEEQQQHKATKAQLAAYQQDEQLRDAGLGHLSKRQRGAVLREMTAENMDFTPEAAVAMATELGFSTTPATPPPASNGSSQEGGPTDEQTQETEESLSALGLMEQARRAAATNQGSPDLVSKMKATKSKEELRGIIRDQGPRQGLIHEWDVP